MTFSPALSLGIASLDEYLDIGLLDAPSANELLERLRAAASSGLRFVAARKLAPGEPSVSALVTGARYVVAFAQQTLAPLGGKAWLAERVREFNEVSERSVLRDVKGIGRRIDLKSYVSKLRVGDDACLDELERVGLVGQLVPLEVTMRIGQDGSARMVELVEGVLQVRDFPYQALRAALLAGERSPLDAPAVRASEAHSATL
jgi:hypothetical protein